MTTDIITEPRFEITIDRCEFTERQMGIDLSGADCAEEAFALVAEWIEENHLELRLDCRHDVSELETTEFEVDVEDTEIDEDDSHRYCSVTYYVHPDEPDDADGQWKYRGCYNSVEYRVCESFDGGKDWWWMEDYRNLGEHGRKTERTYTQDTSLIHEELVEEEPEEEEYDARFVICIDDEFIDEREVCKWEGVADLKDIDDADEMFEAVYDYIVATSEGREIGHRFTVEVYSCCDDDDEVEGWVELEKDEDA